MSKRPSVISPGISSATIANGHANLAPPSTKDEKLRSPSPSTNLSVSEADTQATKFDPDEIFRKHTIADVKFIQQRLRVDADAKQEELRLMVGERYRDLLQASTSIISIAKSSQHVTQTFEEIKAAISAPRRPVIPEKTTSDADDDAHLQVLQRLSAHLKLLLDAPEYLWRLIERKKYLQATWLFLLARVVHRALVREDDEESGSWRSQDIDVLAQFPLVKRQWDAISPFRTQIVHKATHFLRDHSAPVEDTCAAILALHLLESRPLTEALSLFLSQRSKSLHSSLGWASDTPANQLNSKKANGHARRRSVLESSSVGQPLKSSGGIKEATHSSLNTILCTLQTARKIFYSNPETSQDSLAHHVLQFIQSDAASTSGDSRILPAELYLTTQSILTMLPSAAHFNLLPHNIKAYRPYIDLSSPSSNIRHDQFSEKLNAWFGQSLSYLQPSIERWFNDLNTVKEVWGIRSSTQTWIHGSGLETDEIEQMTTLLNEICQARVIAIWNTTLDMSLKEFKTKLSSTVASLLDGVKRSTPSDDLFRPPPLPTTLQTISEEDNAFIEYKALLRRQLLGRNTLLDGVLELLEACARTIQQDLLHIKEADPDLSHQLEGGYRPHADHLCASVPAKIYMAGASISPARGSCTRGLVFLAQLSEELSFSSPFIHEIGCQPSIAKDFKTELLQHHDEIVDRWREHIISQILEDFPDEYSQSESQKPSDPSSGLIHALLSLSDALQEVATPRYSKRRQSPVAATLRKFITSFSEQWDEEPDAQYALDLAFLRQITAIHGNDLDDVMNSIQSKVKASLPEGVSESDLYTSASLSLSRMQNLFATLLPQELDTATLQIKEKTSPLLPIGIPPAEQQYQSALILAKPSSRFGLLMVEGA